MCASTSRHAFPALRFVGRSRAWCAMRRVAFAVAAAFSPMVMACDIPAGRLVAIEGKVEIKPAGSNAWSVARLEVRLCPGDQLAVRGVGRAAVVLSNDVLVRLDQNTTLNLPSVSAQPAAKADSELGLVQGAVHVITRFRKRLGVTTPFVNALVDGTEFTVQSSNNESRVIVAEGRVRTVNDAGEAIITAGQAVEAGLNIAPKPIQVRPLDAMSWAIHYPQIIRLQEPDWASTPSMPKAPALQAAQAAAVAGQFQQALELLGQGEDATPRIAAFRASLHLGLGRIETARQVLAGWQGDVAQDADLAAVQAIIHVTRNENAEALAAAQAAVAQQPASVSAQLALSYALQANRRVKDALAAAERATDLAADNATAWNRRAELELSLGRVKAGGVSARKALAVQPSTASHTMLGFSQLLSGKIAAAEVSLNAALQPDGADPMAHFGLGLIQISRGNVAEGRREIEIAVLLDPSNADLRGYLGRGYMLEHRSKVAGDQFDLARRLDPASPTPWYLDAFRKLYDNDPIGAIADYQEAIARNDNRAVLTSTELLDHDRAARNASLAQAYQGIGFDQPLYTAATRALNDDPTSAVAHRMMAEAYKQMGTQELARYSETLQYEIRQKPGQAFFSAEEVALNSIVYGIKPYFSPEEYSALFDAKNNRGLVNAAGGSQGQQYFSFMDTQSWGQGQVSASYYDYRASGLGRNGAGANNAGRLTYFQSLNSTTQLFADILYAEENVESGDINNYPFKLSLDGEYQYYSRYKKHTLGLRYQPSEDEEWLAVARYGTQKRNFVTDYFFDRNYLGTLQTRENSLIQTLDAQYNRLGGNWKLNLGAYMTKHNVGQDLLGSFPPFIYYAGTFSQSTGYGYSSFRPSDKWELFFGVAYNHLSSLGSKSPDRWNGKLGLAFRPNASTSIRLANFHTVQGLSYQMDLLEPTQFNGFSQRFQDMQGTRSLTRAIGWDQKLGHSEELGAEVSSRKLDVPGNVCFVQNCLSPWHEHKQQVYWSKSFGKDAALSIRWVNENISYDHPELVLTTDRISSAKLESRLESLPVRLWIRFSPSWSGQVEAMHGHAYAMGMDYFLPGRQVNYKRSGDLVNLAAHYRQPGGVISWDFLVRNLFNNSFGVVDTNVASPSPPFITTGSMSFLLRTSIAF